ncbi:MAG: hypothetical protein HY741_29185 [Chloroflexi bacterium]|nr:hypothetical protein [Chloroflexota bacterium]
MSANRVIHEGHKAHEESWCPSCPSWINNIAATALKYAVSSDFSNFNTMFKPMLA